MYSIKLNSKHLYASPYPKHITRCLSGRASAVTLETLVIFLCFSQMACFPLFFPNVVTGSWLVSSADPRYMASWPAPLGQGINIPFESIPHHLESIYIHVMKTKTRSNSETFPIMRSKGPVKFQFKVKITMNYFTSAKSVERCQTMF